jgi:hypothetical protein
MSDLGARGGLDEIYVGGVADGGADVDPQGRGANTQGTRDGRLSSDRYPGQDGESCDVMLCNLLLVHDVRCCRIRTADVRVWSVGTAMEGGWGNKVVRLAKEETRAQPLALLEPLGNLHHVH